MKNELLQFTGYQKFVVVLLAWLMFTVVTNFGIIMPLGDTMMKELEITASQFGMIVSCFAFGAGIAGFVTAAFADRFDRKKLLLFLYAGLILGTAACGMSDSYEVLLVARSITGLFGGVISSIIFAIVADLFALNQRGRVMGYIQLAFALSQVGGIPLGLILANWWSWNMTFIVLTALSLSTWFIIAFALKPLNKHLHTKPDDSVFLHFGKVLTNRNYLIGFLFTLTVSMGGMFATFSAPFMINNVGISPAMLPVVFLVSGISMIVVMPLIGKLSDKVDKSKVFITAMICMIGVVVVFGNLSITPFIIATLIIALVFGSVGAAEIPMSALNTAVPEQTDKGAYLSLCSSLQQLTNGLGAMLAGMIIVQTTPGAPLENFNIVCYIVALLSVFAIFLIQPINRIVKKNQL